MVAPVWFWRRSVNITEPQIETVKLDSPLLDSGSSPAHEIAAVEGRVTCAGSPFLKATELCARRVGKSYDSHVK